MKKLMMTILLVFCAVPFAVAQDDYHKFEVYAGYSRQKSFGFRGDLFNANYDQKNGNGFDTSATYNFSNHLGVKFDVSYHRSTGGFVGPSSVLIPVTGSADSRGGASVTKVSSLSFQGGVQIKNNSKEKRFKPFGHVMAGMTRLKTDGGYVLYLDGISTSGFSTTVGGGLDIRLSKRIDVRVFQFNYNPVFARSKTYSYSGPPVFYTGGILPTGTPIVVDSKRHNLYNFGFGIVFH